MRPLGAIVLGAYTDKHGRRAGLLLTLSLMSVGIFSIACMPGYATIGLLAPLLVLIGRLLQGFLRGHGIGRRVSLFVGDRNARPQGFLCQLAIGEPASGRHVRGACGSRAQLDFAAGKNGTLGGGRVPLLLGCAIIPFLFRLRRSLQETMSSWPESTGRARLRFSTHS